MSVRWTSLPGLNGGFGSKAAVQIALALRRPVEVAVEKQTLDTAMSAFGGKADSIQHGILGPLLAKSGHSLPVKQRRNLAHRGAGGGSGLTYHEPKFAGFVLRTKSRCAKMLKSTGGVQ